MNKIIFASIVLLSVLSAFIFPSEMEAQIIKNGGSTYSIFGLGDLNYSTSSRTDGMGIMGISLMGNYSNSINPAAWTGIPFTKFSTRFIFQRTNSSDGTNTANRNYGDFDGFNLAIPINTGNGWILSMGINNYSKVNYDIKLRGTAYDESYTQYYSGVGGLTRINLGFSYLVFKYFSLGAQFNYTFGTIEKTTQIIWDNATSHGLYNTHDVVSNSLSGFYASGGLIFHGFGKLLKNKKLENLNAGVYFSSPLKINSSISGIYDRSTNRDSVSITEGSINVPWSLGFGVSNTFSGTLVVAADLFFQNWKQYKYYGSHPDEIQNSIRTGIGLEYTPSVKLEDPMYKRISYRIGGSFTQDYLRIGGQSINEFGISAGLNIPLSRFNDADLVFSYISRGKSTDGLIKDNIYRAGVSVNIGELWFLKHKGE